MLTVTRRLLELVRFSHTLFALPFALLSAALAWHREGEFRWVDLVGILLCMVFARSAAMAFNRLADRRLDALNPRTAGRHLPAGTLSVPTVAAFTIGCAAGFVASTLLFLVRTAPTYWPLYLSGPVLAFICLYSLTNRFTPGPFWLGARLLAPCRLDRHPGMRDLTLIGGVFFGGRVRHPTPAGRGFRPPGPAVIPYGSASGQRCLALCATSHARTAGGSLRGDAEMGPSLVGLVAVAILLAYEHWLVRPDDLTRGPGILSGQRRRECGLSYCPK